MKRRTSAFSITKTRKRALFATAMVAGLAVTGLGVNAALTAKGDADAANKAPTVNKLAEINPSYEKYLEDVKNGEGDKWNVVPNKYISVSKEKATKKSVSRMYGDSNSSSLPTKYNLREDGFATTIKDQGSDGLCWAFSSTTAMESYLKKHGMNNNIEFSPKQLDYMRVAGTPVGNYVRDVIDGGEYTLGSGYNFLLAGLTFGTTGKAPVKEADFFAKLKTNDPENLGIYQSWNDFENIRRAALNIVDLDLEVPFYTKPMNYSDVTSNDVDYLVTDYSVYITDATLINSVKKHIYEDGAVEIETFSPEGACYDEETKTIVDLGEQLCNPNGTLGHAMSIVGWDDNYTYTNPQTGATETGAFILQNSWGKTSMFTDLGLTDADKVALVFQITADSMPEEPGKTKEEVFAEWKAKMNAVIGAYDPPEILYYAYDFNTQDSIFGMIDKMVENTYDAVFGSVDGTGFKGMATPKTEYSNGIAIDDEIFTFSTGSQAMQIDAIGVNSLLPAPDKTGYKVEIDTGKGFKELDTYTFESKKRGQKTIKLSTPEIVKGDFKLRVGWCVYNDAQCEDTVIYYDKNKDGQTDGLDDYDYTDAIAMVVYLNNHNEKTPEPEPSEKEGNLTWVQEQTHTIGDGKDLIIKINLPISEFKGIEIDDKAVDKKNYTVTSGSTIITIPSKYADTLKAGKHTLAIDFKTSYFITDFTVKGNNKPTNTDAGGDEDNDPANIPDTSAAEEKQPAKKTPNTKTGNTGANTKITGEGVTETFLLTLPIIFAAEFFVIRMYRKNQK